MPDAWTPPDDGAEPAPGLGIGYALLLVVVGLLLLLVAAGAAWVVLDLVRTMTGQP